MLFFVSWCCFSFSTTLFFALLPYSLSPLLRLSLFSSCRFLIFPLINLLLHQNNLLPVFIPLSFILVTLSLLVLPFFFFPISSATVLRQTNRSATTEDKQETELRHVSLFHSFVRFLFFFFCFGLFLFRLVFVRASFFLAKLLILVVSVVDSFCFLSWSFFSTLLFASFSFFF